MYFQRVVLWGSPDETLALTYQGLEKAFKHIGYEVLRLDDSSPIGAMNFSQTLFMVDGRAMQKVPLRDDCFYVLFNSMYGRYKSLYASHRVLIVTTGLTPHDHSHPDYSFYETSHKSFYLPWVTHLLPHEIELVKSQIPVWVGCMQVTRAESFKEVQELLTIIMKERTCLKRVTELLKAIQQVSPTFARPVKPSSPRAHHSKIVSHYHNKK